jgi:hypothetical protein
MAGLTWWMIVIIILVVVAFIVVAALGTMAIVDAVHRRSARRSGNAFSHRTAVQVRSMTWIRVARVIAIGYAAASVIGTVYDTLEGLLSDTVMVNLPVGQFWPRLPSTVELSGTTADVVGGGFDQAMVEVSGLDTTTQVWLAAGGVLQGTTNVVIGLTVVLLCTSIIQHNPFRAKRGINLAAAAIIVGGLGWQICDAVAGGLASTQVLGATGSSLDTSKVHWNDVRDVIGLPAAASEWTVDFWPIWVGLALFAVSAAFQYGQKLQKDTAGLV